MNKRPSRLAGLVALLGVAILAGAVLAGIFLPVVGGLGAFARQGISAFESVPDQLDEPELPQRSVVLAADGSIIATVYYQNRVEVPLTSVAPVMREAIIAIEDSRFLEHNGMDLRGTLRALVSNSQTGSIQQGGSTLTQQYVKNVLIATATDASELEAAKGRTPSRKLREIRFALALERRYTKPEILERYLNIVYFGAGAYGVEAASRRYFNKAAADLTLPEAATLAGIVQAPTAFDPTRNPKLSQDRRDLVLRRMAELGYITGVAAEAAVEIPMKEILNPSVVDNGCTSSYAPFFCDYVLQVMRTDSAFGEDAASREALLRRGGLTIRTSLQPQAQKSASAAVSKYIPKRDASQRAAAITMVTPQTGAIVAMTQNRDWGTSGRGYTTYNYNVNTAYGGSLGMQAGSTFKVFTAAAALEAGISPAEQVNASTPKTFENFTNCTTGEKFGPLTFNNSTGSGTYDMPTAMAVSANTYFITLAERIGLCEQARIAESMGVRLGNGDSLLRVPSFSLGTMEVSPLSMAGAYATFANHGVFCTPVAILDITDRNGDQVAVPRANCRQVLDRDVADSVAAMLTGVIDGPVGSRTAASMSLDRPAGGKTGSTNDNAALWFCGFTPDLAAAVWTGDPRGGFQYPMADVTIKGVYYATVYGSTIPGPIWRESMEGALAGSEPQAFELQTTGGLLPARTLTGNTVVLPRPSPSPSPSPTDSVAPSPSPSPSDSGSPSPSPSPGPTPTPSPTPSPSPSPTDSGSASPSATDTSSASATATSTEAIP